MYYYTITIINHIFGQILRRDIDAFGTEQTAEGPPYCRALITGSAKSQINLEHKVTIKGVTSDVEKVLIHCTRDQPLGEYYYNMTVMILLVLSLALEVPYSRIIIIIMVNI